MLVEYQVPSTQYLVKRQPDLVCTRYWGLGTEEPNENGRADPLPFLVKFRTLCFRYFPLLTAFFSSAPGVNFATLCAAILIVAPVCGLRPFRAFRCDTEKVPKPIRATRSPFRKAD